MNEVMFTIGTIVGWAICIIAIIVGGMHTVTHFADKQREKAHISKTTKNKHISCFIGVKIPNKTKFYTIIAFAHYFDNEDIVVILDKQLWRSLPGNSLLYFPDSKIHHYWTEKYKTVADLKCGYAKGLNHLKKKI